MYLREVTRPILNGQINFPVSLAPMVGLTHVALRRLVRRYLPADAVTFWPTEMLSSWRLPKEDLATTEETQRGPDEDFLVPQILGNEEQPIAESLRKLEAWGVAGVDINMGCPVRKALKHNYGVALMGDPEYAAEVVRLTVRNARVPISVKLRAGLQNDPEYLIRFIRGLENAGASWITLHPRVAGQQRRGAADWSQIKFVRERVGLPVVGNGDVQTVDDVFRMQNETGCDGVMVGRALAARPWLLWQVGRRLGLRDPVSSDVTCPATPEEEGAEYGRNLLVFLSLLEESFSFEGGAKRFRFYLRMTTPWLEFGHALYAACAKGDSYADLRATVAKFFAVPQSMSAKTQLRE